MSAKREDKKLKLRENLLSSARTRIAGSGLGSLRARDIAEDAGCALGALYTVFQDLDSLILEINVETMQRIDAIAEAALAGEDDPAQQLKVLGRAYLAFARQNLMLWRALFEHPLAEGKPVPEQYAQNLNGLMLRIATPLAQLQPELTGEALIIRARTLFSAVHGLVWMSLDNRFVGLPAAILDAELERFIDLLLKGLGR